MIPSQGKKPKRKGLVDETKSVFETVTHNKQADNGLHVN